MEDLHVSRGPVSSMPGSIHHLPEGSMCDAHPDRVAVKRVQGETDSFGTEYYLMCQECFDEHQKALEKERKQPRFCEWCGNKKLNVIPFRDIDEGMSGRLYDVCYECRKLNLNL